MSFRRALGLKQVCPICVLRFVERNERDEPLHMVGDQPCCELCALEAQIATISLDVEVDDYGLHIAEDEEDEELPLIEDE
jgi:hypothetical protein